MAARITIWAAHRVITGRCEKISPNDPVTGRPSFSSTGANDGHEWEARVGIEDYLDSASVGNPMALQAAISTTQTIVIGAVRAQLLAQGAPAELVDATPAQIRTSVAQAQAPAPSQAPPAAAEPGKQRSTWGGPKKAEPEPEAEDDSDGPPPKTGSQFFAWAGKQVGDGRKLVYDAWRAAGCKGKVMQADSKSLLKAWNKAKELLAESEGQS